MNDTAGPEVDVFDLLMKDHRDIETLFGDFDQLQRAGKDTGAVIAAACTALRMHDALETETFYCAVADAAQEAALKALLEKSEDEHNVILELIDKLEQARGDVKAANSRFAVLAERMKQHIGSEEAKLFPLVKALTVDLEAIVAAMKVCRPALSQAAA